MAKTTKSVVPVRALQKFNKSNTVNSITIRGVTSLADIEIDGKGDVSITLNRDVTKIDTVETTSDIITVKKSGTKLTIGLDQEKLGQLIDSRIERHL